jgi:NAD(P)H-nitrite reductase large subunit
MRHLIVGNGMAGVAAAQTLRDLDAEAEIAIVTEEEAPFYSRPGLMYYMMGRLKGWDLLIAKGDAFYQQLGVSIRYGRAARVAVGEDALEMASGERLPFDRLLLATGSKSRRLAVPGADLDGIHFMYSLQDCREIMARTRRGMKAVLVGGGLLGAELAEVWRHFGLHVTFLVQEPWYFRKGLSEAQGRIVEAGIRRHGVDLHLGEQVAALAGTGAVSKVVTQSGREFDADAVGVTIGVEPNTDLAAASGLNVGRGIVVDESLRTSRPNVFAAGDCAEILPAGEARSQIEQLWYSAEKQGRAAARAMAGDTRRYDPGVFYNSAMFFDVDYVSIGESRVSEGAEEQTVISRDRGAARRFLSRGGVVTGITSVGANDNAAAIMDLVTRGVSLEVARSRLGGRRWTSEVSSEGR